MDIEQEILQLMGINLKEVDPITLDRLIRKGLPHTSFNRIKTLFGLSSDALAHAVGLNGRAYSFMESAGRLPLVASDRLYRIARILAIAITLFNDKDSAVGWLLQPQIGLRGEKPFDLILTEPGSKEVEALLGRIEHGVIS